MNFYDFYALPVTRELRKTVVNYIFDLVSQLIPDLTRIKKEEKSPIPEPPIKTWDTYYNEQFQAWNYARLYPILIKRITLSKCWKEAKNKVQFLSDPTLLLRGLTKRYGLDFFNPKSKLGTAGSHMIKRLSDAKNPTILDVVILRQLRRSDPDSLEGTKLAEELNIAVQNYLQKYPPSEKKLYEECVRKTVYQQFLKYEKSKKSLSEDKKLFDIENLKKLKQLYGKYTSERKVKTKTKGKSIEKLSKEAEEYMKRVGKLNLTQKGFKVHQQITDFEVVIFALSDEGRTIFEYLRRALIPTIFLNKYGNIGKYCKFFQAKISTGAFELRALNDANLAHYFPELVMKYISRKRPADLNKDLVEFTDKVVEELQEKGDIESLTNFIKKNIRHYFPEVEDEELATAISTEIFGKSEASKVIDSFFSEGMRSKLLGDREKLSDKELAEATDQIASQLLYEMNQTLEAFVYAKRSMYGNVTIPKFHLKEFYWKGYTSKPQDICKKDTGTGYVKTKRLGPRKYREEPISNEQLVICYDPEVGFSCGTIRKIIENIVTGIGNPSTQKPYPEVFVAKMRERYPHVFKEEEELEEKVEKEMEEERLAIEKELSELEEWPKDIQRQYELLFGERFEEPEKEKLEEEEEEVSEEEEEMSAEEIKAYKGPMLVFFTASWGEEGPDEEVWDEFKETYPEIRFVRVDIDEEQELAEMYAVQSIPLFILFNKGKQVERFKKWKEKKVENLLAEI